ncbi:MAG: transcription antitermination factor NusB [Armatimonadetes bacterium]|nr:transcription antitermination factor NusB [Armatimonadota bacterium]
MAVVSKRHAARELALKMLFQVDIGRVPVADVLAHFAPDEEIGEPPAESIAYAHDLVRGTAQHLKEIDRLLSSLTEEWTFDRLANVDRNILRMAVYELLYESGVPEEVAINEAVELAKAYSTEESGKFVNGILGNLSRRRAVDTAGIAPEQAAVPPVEAEIPSPSAEISPLDRTGDAVLESADQEESSVEEAGIDPSEDMASPRRRRQPLRMSVEKEE